MSTENLPLHPPVDPVAAIVRHLQTGEDVIRCAAARAIGTIGDEKAAPVLVDALLDEDPDVRSDAMAALVSCARREDADAIRRSLMGDPVKDVKVSAIQALCRLKDWGAVPLLRALAKDRCDHDVTWSEESGLWDEWLDVQIAAIGALGALGVHDAIEDLLEARVDELGQELDHVVFAALAQIPEGGIAALLDLLRDSHARVRERALSALLKAKRDLLAPISDLLVQDASPDVRRLAIGCLNSDSPAVSDLALGDPDVTVRRAALAAFASLRQDIAEAALGDPDEEVKALALEAVVAGSEQSDSGDLAANVRAWMTTSGVRLAATCAAVLPRLSGAEAEDALCGIVTDTDRPQEVRISALRSLGTLGSETSIETLRNTAVDASRQVRISALAALVELATEGPERFRAEIRQTLASAIRGDLFEADAVAITDEPEQGSSVGASKFEDTGSRHISITPDGEIVPMEELPDRGHDESDPRSNVIEGQFPQSTLQAMQTPVTALPRATDTMLTDDELTHLAASETQGRRRRAAVDGPDDIGTDLRFAAMRIAANCPGCEIEQALVAALDETTPDIRAAAFEVIAQRSEYTPLSTDLISKSTNALGDPDPRVRGYASLAVVRGSSNAADHLAGLLDDPDAIVRAAALKSVAATAPDKAVAGFRDGSALVRRSALESVLEHGNIAELEECLRICLDEGWTDSLAEASKRSTEAHSILISILARENMTRRQTHSALDALAAAGLPA